MAYGDHYHRFIEIDKFIVGGMVREIEVNDLDLS